MKAWPEHRKICSPPPPSKSYRSVGWDRVYVREFERLPGGGGGVPYNGTWALGLGKLKKEYCVGSIGEFEERREEELKNRKDKLKNREKKMVNGETRQFDYKRSGRYNPLFERLDEKERKQVFFGKKTESLNAIHESSSKRRSKRSNPIVIKPNSSVCVTGMNVEQVTMLAKEQEKEFNEIRTGREQVGCNCGSEWENISKAPVKKLRAILQSRGESFALLTKYQMLQRVEEIKLKEQLTQCQLSPTCECRLNGISCHSDACGVSCGQQCGNDLPGYTYNSPQVKTYRKTIIESVRLIQPETPACNNQVY